jgi:protein O-mannosyl-transferase
MRRLPGGPTFTCLFLVVLALGIFGAYSGSFAIGFPFDDFYGIVNNPAIRSMGNIPRFFTDPYAMYPERGQPDLRPVLLATYALNYRISGLGPWSYHVLNLLLHFTAALLVFVIVRDHLWWPPGERGPAAAGRLPAAAAALFFALAPLNTQAVNYIWARSALLCVTLYLAAFLAFLRRRLVLGSVFFSLALLTKAIAITLPLMLLIHAVLYRDRDGDPNPRRDGAEWRRRAPSLALSGLLALASLGYRALVLPVSAEASRHAPWVTPWIWFMSQWSALLYYVRLFVWPRGLSLDHDFPYTTSLLQPRAWASLLALLLWAALALGVRRRHPPVAFATAWFFVTLAPESSFVPLAEVINEHRPYIASSLGLSLLLAWLLDQASARLATVGRQATLGAACLLLCIPAVAIDRHRTWEWDDVLRIWEAAVVTSPGNGRAWINVGQLLLARGDLAGARRHLERAGDMLPGNASVYLSLTALEMRAGNLPEALRAAERAAALAPDYDRAHVNLGIVLATMGRGWDAAAAFRRALELNPDDRQTRATLALVTAMQAGMDALYARGDPEAAAVEFRKVLERQPDHYAATFQLATALDRAGRPADARVYWEKLLGMAERQQDSRAVATIRARLARER